MDSGVSPKLVEAGLGLLAVFSTLGAALMSHADVRFLDRVVAEIDGALVSASDVAIARALGLFELNPALRAPMARLFAPLGNILDGAIRGLARWPGVCYAGLPVIRGGRARRIAERLGR